MFRAGSLGSRGDRHDLEVMQKNCMKFWDGRRTEYVDLNKNSYRLEQFLFADVCICFSDLCCFLFQRFWEEGSSHPPPSHSAWTLEKRLPFSISCSMFFDEV